jgi:hypothetical protein
MLRRLTWQKHSGRDPSLPLIALVLALVVLGAASAVIPQPAPSPDAAEDQGAVFTASIDMTCFPPLPEPPTAEPGIGHPPPCSEDMVFFGLDPANFYLENPSGKVRIRVKDDGTAAFDIRLKGIVPGLTVTTYLIHYFPFRVAIDPLLVPEIFRPLPGFEASVFTGEPVAIAAHSVPLAKTSSAYTEGLGREPHQIFIRENGTARYRVNLDFNPLKPNQTPLRNAMVSTNQALAPAGSIAAQPNCCPIPPNFPVAPRPQPVGASYVREFDPVTGFQVLDAEGRPKLPRSPVAAAFISVIARIDNNTSGMHPGIGFIPSFDPTFPPVSGDHVVLGIFDLRASHQ